MLAVREANRAPILWKAMLRRVAPVLAAFLSLAPAQRELPEKYQKSPMRHY